MCEGTLGEQYDSWEAGVRGPYDQMALITIEPHWAKLLEFETTLPQAVADLVRAQQADTATSPEAG